MLKVKYTEFFFAETSTYFEGIEFGTRGGTITSDVDPNYWNFVWPKLLTFGPIIFYVLLCWWAWARDYQLKVAGVISLLYSFLMIYVFVALIVQGPDQEIIILIK